MALFQVFAVAFFALTAWLVARQRIRRASLELVAPTWRRLAEAHGWYFRDSAIEVDSRLEGVFEGHEFTAVAQVAEGRVELTVRRSFPEPGEAPTLTRSIASFAEDHFLSALSDLVGEARSLDLATDTPWRALASQHRLSLSTRRGEHTLRGEVDGHSVRIGTTADPVETVIRVRIGEPWPDEVLIQPREADADRRGLSTGNPILDSLVTVTAPAEEQLTAALRDPRLAEDLLAVLHPYPRSSVVGGHVQMHCPGRLDAELSERLADALSLARRLREGYGVVR